MSRDNNSLQLLRFANVIVIRDGSHLIVDPIWHEASCIDERVAANLDVQPAIDALRKQHLVYDDGKEWPASNLDFLDVAGEPMAPFSGYWPYYT
jgi:hypothetical protein